ncbi:MAG: metallophosphoesterase [Clostridia bacterium]|nr:metallophosphoesterase [Clostridia bacterium]
MKKFRRALSVILSVCMLLCVMQCAVYAEPEKKAVKPAAQLNFSVISDTHIYPECLYTDTQEWRDFCHLDAKEYTQSEQLIRTGLATVAARAEQQGTKYLLIPGDLTKDSEYMGHTTLAAMLEDFENETGIQVFVTPGNHDINNQDACSFETGTKKPARAITAAEFKEVYAELGYDLADSFYVPEDGTTQGMLSYSADLGDGFYLISADTAKYDAVNPAKAQTDGCITEGLMNWIRERAEYAASIGEEPIIMCHHSTAAHMKVEPTITFAFVLDDYQQAAEQLADMGINFSFTGHLHTTDISRVVSDNGNVIYDCETASLTGYPNTYREVNAVTDENGVTSLTFNDIKVDEAQPVVSGGVTYSDFGTDSFAICFGGAISESGYASCADFLMGIVKSYLGKYCRQITEAGGVLEFLKTMDIDLEQIIQGFLEPYIGEGIYIGGYRLFTVDNLMWFIEDLLGQLEDLYIKDPETLYAIIDPRVREICSIKVSDIPCTKFIDTLHFGDETKGGTFGDAVLSAMNYWYTGNENIFDENDPDLFMQDVIVNLRSEDGAIIKELFNILVDFVFDDVLDKALLSKLEIRLDKLFNDTKLGAYEAKKLNFALNSFLRGNMSYQNLVDTVFEFGVLPYTSLFDIVDKLLMQEYLTDSQFESIGCLAAYVLQDFSSDFVPQEKGDTAVTYSEEPVEVEASKANYRIPTLMSRTVGDDSGTQANISWFSKYSLPDTDIEIIRSDSELTAEDFTGIPTVSAPFTIEKSEEPVVRSFPGIDIGIIGFINYNVKLYRHYVKLSGLEKGGTYYYRVGNAARNWWSEVCTLKTADGGDRVTFFHMSDPQSQTEEQYTRGWANTVKTAFELYPEAAFIMGTGDFVDSGMNLNQWQWMFDTAAANLGSTYLMPATGNHEQNDDYTTVSNFMLPNVPEQNTASGVYYSYTYNNVLVMVLNTNDLNDDNALNEEQINWLKQTAKSSDAQWKIVALHKAPYSNGSHYDDKDVCAFRDQLGSLLPDLGIDLVLQGHDHTYLRTYSLDGNKVAYTEYKYLAHGGNIYKTQITPTGTSYVISGTSGVKVYPTKDVRLTDEYFPRAQKLYNSTAQMFSAVEIEGGILYFTAYSVNGDSYRIVDKFAIQKDTSAGSTVDGYTEDDDPDDSLSAFERFFKKIGDFFTTLFTLFTNIFKMYILGM